MEEFNSNKDFDIEYDPLVAAIAATAGSDDVGDENISIVQSKSFVFTQGWDSEMIVDYRINEEEFHKISFMHCHFFIRKSSDSNSDVYDFREVSGKICLVSFQTWLYQIHLIVKKSFR